MGTEPIDSQTKVSASFSAPATFSPGVSLEGDSETGWHSHTNNSQATTEVVSAFQLAVHPRLKLGLTLDGGFSSLKTQTLGLRFSQADLDLYDFDFYQRFVWASLSFNWGDVGVKAGRMATMVGLESINHSANWFILHGPKFNGEEYSLVEALFYYQLLKEGGEPTVDLSFGFNPGPDKEPVLGDLVIVDKEHPLGVTPGFRLTGALHLKDAVDRAASWGLLGEKAAGLQKNALGPLSTYTGWLDYLKVNGSLRANGVLGAASSPWDGAFYLDGSIAGSIFQTGEAKLNCAIGSWRGEGVFSGAGGCSLMGKVSLQALLALGGQKYLENLFSENPKEAIEAAPYIPTKADDLLLTAIPQPVFRVDLYKNRSEQLESSLTVGAYVPVKSWLHFRLEGHVNQSADLQGTGWTRRAALSAMVLVNPSFAPEETFRSLPGLHVLDELKVLDLPTSSR